MSGVSRHPGSHRRHRGFTLVEVIIASVIAAFVFGALWASMGQLTKTRAIAQERMMAHLRADTALNAVRRDVTCVLRSDDLFWTKLRIIDNVGASIIGPVDRDDLLLFSSRLRLSRDTFGQGEGIEYETQYRIIDDLEGPVLWQRRDAVPDEYYDGGGVVVPVVEDIVGLNVEAYDGTTWYAAWDSDELGLPLALRITVTVPVSMRVAAPPVVLRTVVSIDAVLPPFDAEAEEDEEGDEPPDDGGTDEGAGEDTGGGGGGNRPPPGGGNRPPPGGGGTRPPPGGGGRGDRS